MSDHFSITCSPAELGNAMTKLGWLEEQLGGGGEGGKLSRLHGDSTSWTGQAATACLGEMTTIATTMTGTSPKLTAASTAVKTFRDALETAQQDTLPKLNTRWAESESTYDSAVGSASSTYGAEAQPLRNLPPEDGQDPLAAARAKRDNAISSAATVRVAAQKGINADYDTMITGLQQAAKACGDGLAGAMAMTFSADQWKAVKGGHIPVGMLAQLRQQVFGADSLLHHSDGIRVGEYVAGKLEAEARKGDPTDKIDPEVVALMQQFGGDQAFVEGMMTKLGPSGMAWVSMRARHLYEYGARDDEDGGKAQGKVLLAALTAIYGTGSHVYVDGPNGSRPLMDKDWLDHFNPNEYAPLKDNDRWQQGLRMSTGTSGYRPDLLLPFLGKEGVVSAQFSQVVAQRALEDYERWKKDPYSSDASRMWMLYRGDDDVMMDMRPTENVRTGSSDNPFRTELFHIALDRASEYASSSNALMLTHRDSMLGLMTGKEEWLTGGHDGYFHDWGSKTLGRILEQATIGEQKGDVVSADGALWGVADYLKAHPGEHMVGAVRTSLGNVITDPRMMNGALSSVTTPFGPADGYHDDPSHPDLGPFMSKDLWAALHQEGMRDPGVAAKVIQEFGDYSDRTSDNAQHMGYVIDPRTGEVTTAPQLSSLSFYQAEAARHFLGENLLADKDAIQKELEDALERNNQNKEMAKSILGTMVDWAKDPTSIKDDVIGKITDFAVDKVVDWTMPSSADIEKEFQGSIDALQSSLSSSVVTPGMWDDMNHTSAQLVRDITSGTGTSPVVAPIPGYTDGRTQHQTYTGDPRQYVGHDSQYVGNGQVITDDFLTYDSHGKPNGVVPVDQMNQMQQRAYLNWLHDPSVQQYLDEQNDAIHKARENATHH